jgi:hypothetical protein
VRPRLVTLFAAIAATLAGCASMPAPPPHGLVVADGDTGAVLWRGNATFTVRATSAVAERAVALPGLGEVQVGVGGDLQACRFVWSRDGLSHLVMFTGKSCASREGGRVCFEGARFTAREGEGAPRALWLAGCAEANDLLWGKIDGSLPASVGPKAWRERCVRLPRKKRGCDIVYLKKESASIEKARGADDGFTFTYDGEGWRACFLEPESGPYALRVFVEDACADVGVLDLAGDSADLDD